LLKTTVWNGNYVAENGDYNVYSRVDED